MFIDVSKYFSREVSYPSGGIFGVPADFSLLLKRLLIYAVFLNKSDVMNQGAISWIYVLLARFSFRSNKS